MDSIWIVIVNYRTAGLLVDCLRSLSAQVDDLKNMRVMVVDNNSADGSVAKLTAAIAHEGWSSWISLLPLGKNGGFAFGNNAGIREILALPQKIDYIMLLNPDTVALPGAIRSLLDFMVAHPQAGIAGSQLLNADGSSDNSAHAFPTPLGEFAGSARLGALDRLLHRYAVTPMPQMLDHRCDWVSGASMIVRRQVIEDVGLMDENYFLYFEEVDFCRRAHQGGWQCWYVPASRVVHLEGAATGIRTRKKRRAGYWYDSRRQFFAKHYGISGLVAADVLWSAGRLSYLMRRALRLGANSHPDNSPEWFMFDLLWGDLRALLTGRLWHIQRGAQQS